MAVAIIVAAGTGSRFGGDIPKQFREVKGKMVLEHTISRFEESSLVEELIVVLSETVINEERFEFSSEKPLTMIAGGATRAESVRNGLDVIDEFKGVVAVHDGARPLVTSEEIDSVIQAAEQTGAACLGTSVTDTIKRVADDRIVETVDRSNLWRAATPQCFDVEILRRAYDEAEFPEQATDECSLVEMIGVDISTVEGSTRNIKITYEEDLKIAEVYL